MSNILDFKGWSQMNENNLAPIDSSYNSVNEALTAQGVDFKSHPDVIAMGKKIAAEGKGDFKNVYGKFIEYAGNDLYIKLDPKSYKEDAYNKQLPLDIYCIGSSKYGCPVPRFVSSVFVDAKGKISPNQSEKIQKASLAMLPNPTDDTKVGWTNLDKVWDSYATATFGQYCKNLSYWNYFQAKYNSNKDLWDKVTKPTKGMQSYLWYIIEKCKKPA